jgi:hypothetical protein
MPAASSPPLPRADNPEPISGAAVRQRRKPMRVELIILIGVVLSVLAAVGSGELVVRYMSGIGGDGLFVFNAVLIVGLVATHRLVVRRERN